MTSNTSPTGDHFPAIPGHDSQTTDDRQPIATEEQLYAAISGIGARMETPNGRARARYAFLAYYAVTAGLPGVAAMKDIEDVRTYLYGLSWTLDELTAALLGGTSYNDETGNDRVSSLMDIQKAVTLSTAHCAGSLRPVEITGAIETFREFCQAITEQGV